jgi:hypothetical protein
LTGCTEAPPIVSYDPVAGLQKDMLLFLPGVAIQWLSMNEDYRLTAAMVLVINLNVGVVLFTDGYL